MVAALLDQLDALLDLLTKVDGCVTGGGADGDDWIVDCDIQSDCYVRIRRIILAVRLRIA